MFKFAKILTVLFWLLGLVTYPIVYLINIGRRKRVSPIKNPILLMSATQLAYKIRHKQLRSEDVLNAYITRCEEVNPLINAIVQRRYDKALVEAKEADKIVAADTYSIDILENKYPLLGVPLSVKESLAVEGMSHEAGKYVTGNRIPAEKDAESVALLRSAGAIPFLVSNTPELCFGWETYNSVTGITRNPYDSRRTAGGSSGGEGALLGSGASVIGIGTDAAGSLRLPSMYNGIFCHKSSPYAVSIDGAVPSSTSPLWCDMLNVGPMVRYAQDLPLMMKILNQNQKNQIQPQKEVAVKDIKLYYVDDDGSGVLKSISPDVKKCFIKIADYFENKYNKGVNKICFRYLDVLVEPCMITALRPDVTSIFPYPIKWGAVFKEFLKKIFGCSKSNILCITYGLLRLVYDKINVKHFDEATIMNAKFKAELVDLLQDNAVCFFPTFVKTATYHYDYLRHFLSYSYLSMFNVLGIPSTNCPIGLTKNGMPVGIQIIAAPGCDHLGMIIAKELELAFGGWIPPSAFKGT